VRKSRLHYWLYCYPVSLLLLLVACANGPGTTANNSTVKATDTAKVVTAVLPSPTSTSAQGVGAANCRPPSAITKSSIGLSETQGTGRGMEVWALLFGDMKARQDQKIVWRLTGEGDPQFTTIGPQGEHARVVFGPELHDGSNWHRPGEEWGTGFNFQTAGCWDLHVVRGKTAGDVWIVVK